MLACGGPAEFFEETADSTAEVGVTFDHLGASPVVTVEGMLESRVADYADGSHQYEFLLRDNGTERPLRLHPRRAEKLERLSSGARLRATGHLGAEALAVEATDDVAVTAPAEVMPALEMRKAVVMSVSFTDAAPACTTAAIQDVMYTGARNINGWYEENSFGKVGFSPDVDGNGAPDVVAVNIAATAAGACSPDSWAAAADAAATAKGVNFALYQHRVYVLPANVTCGWAGLAHVGCGSGTGCRAWVKTCTPDVTAHELGHNLRFNHAGTDTNNDGAAESTYGDYSDLMGIGGIGYRHTNAAHKIQAAWLPAEKISSATSGTFRLAPVEVSPSSTPELQTLKLAKANSPGVYYFVSYRRAVGNYSVNLRTTYADRINIHRQASATAQTDFIASLGDGNSWSDPVNGITITQRSHDLNVATVELSTGCTRNTPVVTVSGGAVRPGGSAALSVSVVNRDSAGCGASTLSLTAQLAAGWTGSVSPTSLSLAAGATGSATLAVTAPATATDGQATMGVATSSASGSGIVKVDATPPGAVTNLGAVGSRRSISLSWGVPSDGTGSGVGRYLVFRNGVQLVSTTATSHVDVAVQTGVAYQYTVLAEDRVGNRSAQGNTVSAVARKNGRQ
jgi:hypothetical protein